jgi:hypothetical protein
VSLDSSSVSSINSIKTSSASVDSPSITSEQSSSSKPKATSFCPKNDGFFFPNMSYSFLYALQDNTILHFITKDDEWITIHLMKGDLLIWSGKQLHYGGKYIDMPSNLRLFGTLRSNDLEKVENEFYWFNKETKKIDIVGSMVTANSDVDSNTPDAVDTTTLENKGKEDEDNSETETFSSSYSNSVSSF